LHNNQLRAKSISIQRIRFSSTCNVLHVHEQNEKHGLISVFVMNEDNAQYLLEMKHKHIFTLTQLLIAVLMYDFYQYQNKNASLHDIN
jgi:hypothetical protein